VIKINTDKKRNNLWLIKNLIEVDEEKKKKKRIEIRIL
jgi:hypothetical protein